MAFVIKDRVQQTGTANTTHFNLSGTPTGFQSFSIIGNSNTTYYSATDVIGNWEVGRGTYASGSTSIQRNNVLSSSNGGSSVTFSGTVTVFCTYPSSKAVYLDSSNSAVIGSTADIFTGVNQKLTVTNGLIASYAYASSAAATALYFFKSRSNTAYGTVLSTDTLGNIAFTGAMSNASGVFLEGAIIQGSMDGTPVFDDANGFISSFPTKISFYNRTGGYDTFQDVQLAESMRLSNIKRYLCWK